MAAMIALDGVPEWAQAPMTALLSVAALVIFLVGVMIVVELVKEFRERD